MDGASNFIVFDLQPAHSGSSSSASAVRARRIVGPDTASPGLARQRGAAAARDGNGVRRLLGVDDLAVRLRAVGAAHRRAVVRGRTRRDRCAARPNGAGRHTAGAIAGSAWRPAQRSRAHGVVRRPRQRIAAHRVTRLGISMVGARQIFPRSASRQSPPRALGNPERGGVARSTTSSIAFSVLLERRGQMPAISRRRAANASISTALLTGPKILLVDELSLARACASSAESSRSSDAQPVAG